MAKREYIDRNETLSKAWNNLYKLEEEHEKTISEQVPKGNFKGSQDDDSGWDGE